MPIDLFKNELTDHDPIVVFNGTATYGYTPVLRKLSIKNDKLYDPFSKRETNPDSRIMFLPDEETETDTEMVSVDAFGSDLHVGDPIMFSSKLQFLDYDKNESEYYRHTVPKRIVIKGTVESVKNLSISNSPYSPYRTAYIRAHVSSVFRVTRNSITKTLTISCFNREGDSHRFVSKTHPSICYCGEYTEAQQSKTVKLASRGALKRKLLINALSR